MLKTYLSKWHFPSTRRVNFIRSMIAQWSRVLSNKNSFRNNCVTGSKENPFVEPFLRIWLIVVFKVIHGEQDKSMCSLPLYSWRNCFSRHCEISPLPCTDNSAIIVIFSSCDEKISQFSDCVFMDNYRAGSLHTCSCSCSTVVVIVTHRHQR